MPNPSQHALIASPSDSHFGPVRGMHVDFHDQFDRPTMMVVIIENFDSHPTIVVPEDHILLSNPTSTTVFNLRDRTVPVIVAYIWLSESIFYMFFIAVTLG
ncbi:hypothetical protein C8J56DRAFT_885848 [Mycena floridula]|nr:hypothetical protein C8J56DRAFT_885848 [Mycena floridula]